ncbi:hypothetical protein KYY02_19515 [Streptomyces pimonensis]|uniref:C2H2-type domain-containing protein n=1 Tax=Streptomyces pimonensis TaxID=2860288 RepID=A0ABV4J1I8_9ACTN
MNEKMIHVRPAIAQRRNFARWATGHTPKLRTVSPDTFAVPPHLFVDAPEELLIGALVDGHPYRSPLEDEANGTPPPGTALVDETDPETTLLEGPGSELTGVATAQALDTPEGWRTEPPISLPDPEPVAEQPTAGGTPYACDGCPRTFTTARGRDTHRRQAHTED